MSFGFGKDANFGAHGGCKNDGFWGQCNVSPRLLGSGQHGGGNIQLHKDNPSTTPPLDGTATCNGVFAPAER